MTQYLPHIAVILYLVVIEGLLSFDNALALAALVKKKLRDPRDQKKALVYGIWGAYIVRIAAVFFGTWAMGYPWVKLMAGGYLIGLAGKELFLTKDQEEPGLSPARVFSTLWRTIAAVEVMDVMFSLDSIGVALAVSNVRWVLITGAILGVLMMRVAASLFIRLIERFPLLEKTAFGLVGIAGINVCLKVFHHELPELLFLAIMGGIFIATLLISKPSLEKSNVS